LDIAIQRALLCMYLYQLVLFLSVFSFVIHPRIECVELSAQIVQPQSSILLAVVSRKFSQEAVLCHSQSQCFEVYSVVKISEKKVRQQQNRKQYNTSEMQWRNL
jgi:hypothetical protein